MRAEQTFAACYPSAMAILNISGLFLQDQRLDCSPNL